MRLTIASVGRSRETPEQMLCDLYCARARSLAPKLGFSKLDLVIVDISPAATPDARMKQEAGTLTGKLPARAHRTAVGEAGGAMSSETCAHHLRWLGDSGGRDLAFLIGGPDGVAPSLREAAHERPAFGPQTWPQ